MAGGNKITLKEKVVKKVTYKTPTLNELKPEKQKPVSFDNIVSSVGTVSQLKTVTPIPSDLTPVIRPKKKYHFESESQTP